MTGFFQPLGAHYLGNRRCRFLVWAPHAGRVEVHLLGPEERLVALQRLERGYFGGDLEGVEPGTRYFYRLNGQEERPDPASRFQPEGVHGPSMVIDPGFPWQDEGWAGLPLRDYVIYEIHVGTYTEEGTFAAIIPHLDSLKELGITALELMPIAQFPGERNWGYDGVYPFAVQNSYGGPWGLKELVNACHQRGIAVILDVVYNHLGPEGNYFSAFGPYFTDRHRTPWGAAVNFDGPGSDEVRRFFIDNARYWIREFHIDALRLDAVHTIMDHSPSPFLAELAEAVHWEAERLNRRVYLMAESELNDVRLLLPRQLGGLGLDAHWNDDFHHALHTLLTQEKIAYYQDYGRLEHLAKAIRQGFVYTGDFSHYRQRRHGSSTREIAPERFVVFAQNHDQVGNRFGAERLSRLVSFEGLKLAASMVLLSPALPLLFMGEEFGEEAPFYYFVSFGDPDLIEAVRHGRKTDFAGFGWSVDPPDPQAEKTFLASKINHRLKHRGRHKTLYEFHRTLLALRQELTAKLDLGRRHREVVPYEEEKLLWLHLRGEGGEAVILASFNGQTRDFSLPWPEGRWLKRLDSAEAVWDGPGSSLPAHVQGGQKLHLRLGPWSVAVYLRQEEKLP